MLLDGAAGTRRRPVLDSTLREIEEGSPEWEKRESVWEMLRGEVGDVGLFFRKGARASCYPNNPDTWRHPPDRLPIAETVLAKGMCKNALLPDYVKSGAKGKARKPRGRS